MENHRCLDGPVLLINRRNVAKAVAFKWSLKTAPCQSPRSLHCQASIIASGSLLALFAWCSEMQAWWRTKQFALLGDSHDSILKGFLALQVEVILTNNVGVGRHLFLVHFTSWSAPLNKLSSPLSHACAFDRSYIHEFQSKSLHLHIDQLTCRSGLYQKNSENITKQV